MKTLTPKEKAQELVEKFTKHCYCDAQNNTIIYAKECALIAVEEVMKTPINIKIYAVYDKIYSGVEWWEEVKTEINNL